MAQLREGHHDALTILFDRYHRLVFSVALKIVRDRAEAEDVMQSVFLEVYRSVTQFDPLKGTTKVWILQYAYHRAINRKEYLNLRGYYHPEGVSGAEPAWREPDLTPGRLNAQETGHLLQKALATLSPAQRQVIQLASFEGLSMAEIAAKMQESVANVRNHYYRGLRKLRDFVDAPVSPQKAAGHA